LICRRKAKLLRGFCAIKALGEWLEEAIKEKLVKALPGKTRVRCLCFSLTA